MPDCIQRMLKVANKTGITLKAIKIADEVKNLMPAWQHAGAERWAYHHTRDKCLVNNHHINTVWDLIVMADRGEPSSTNMAHQDLDDCACLECDEDRVQRKCVSPNRCCRAAKSILSKLQPKYNPYHRPPQDDLSLTPTREEKNTQAAQSGIGSMTFDPSVTTKSALSECFRVFTDGKQGPREPAIRLQRVTRGMNIQRQKTINLAGWCENPGRPDAVCAGASWAGQGDDSSTTILVNSKNPTRISGELLAMTHALQQADPGTTITVRTASKQIITGLTKKLKLWEDSGWLGVQDKEQWQSLVYSLRCRSAQTDLTLARRGNTDAGICKAREMAKKGASQQSGAVVNTEVPDKWNIQGAKLCTVTQKLAYKSLTKQAKQSLGSKALKNVTEALSALKEDDQIKGKTPDEIWQGVWSKQSRKNVSQFLYKAMHGAQKVGMYWRNIEGAEDRAKCTICGVVDESMQHILLECPSTARKEVWKLARRTWPTGYQKWRTVDMGLILGSGAINLKADPRRTTGQKSLKTAKRKAQGRSELMQDLIRESAHLIWVMRCERVVGDRKGQAGKSEIQRRWFRKIDDKLLSERALATRPRAKAKTKRRLTFKWDDVIEVENGTHPSDGWLTMKGFLVGVKRPRPPRPVSSPTLPSTSR
jgi:hypothetical protein